MFVNEMIIQSNNKIDEKKGNKFSVIPSMAKILKKLNLYLVISSANINRKLR